MKTKEELNALKEEAETASRKLHELTEREMHSFQHFCVIFRRGLCLLRKN